MMFWNYRLVKFIEDGEPRFSVQEVYYNEDNRPEAYCDISIMGNSYMDCIKDIAWIIKGMTKPVLKFPEDFALGDT